MADYTPDPYAQALNQMGMAQMQMPNPYTRFGGSRLNFLDDDYAGAGVDRRARQSDRASCRRGWGCWGYAWNDAQLDRQPHRRPSQSGRPSCRRCRPPRSPRPTAATPAAGGRTSGVTTSGGDLSNANALQSMIKAAGGEAGIRAQMANWQAGPLGNGQKELDDWTAQQHGAQAGAGGASWDGRCAGTGGTPAGWAASFADGRRRGLPLPAR